MDLGFGSVHLKAETFSFPPFFNPVRIRVWTVLLLSLVFFSSSVLVLGLNRFGMGIRSRVRVSLFF